VAAVVCQACGAKTKGGRLRCPRCGEILEAAQPASSAAPATRYKELYARHHGPLVLAATLLSIVVLLVVVGTRRAEEVSVVQSPVVEANPAPRARHGTVAAGQPDAGFLDPRAGGAAAYKAGDYAGSLEHYKKAVSLNPNDGDALNNLGQLLARTGQPAEAIPYFDKAVQLYPSVWAYRFNLAHAHGQLGNWSQAVEDYRRARSLFPEDYVTHFNLANALHKLGDEEAAVSELRKGAQLAPAEPSFHLSLGISLERLNRPEDAVKSYEEYLSLASAGPDADKVKARIEELRKPA